MANEKHKKRYLSKIRKEALFYSRLLDTNEKITAISFRTEDVNSRNMCSYLKDKGYDVLRFSSHGLSYIRVGR